MISRLRADFTYLTTLAISQFIWHRKIGCVMENEWERMRKKRLWHNLKYYPTFSWIDWRKSWNIPQNTRLPSQYSNPSPTECKSVELPLEPTCSVCAPRFGPATSRIRNGRATHSIAKLWGCELLWIGVWLMTYLKAHSACGLLNCEFSSSDCTDRTFWSAAPPFFRWNEKTARNSGVMGSIGIRGPRERNKRCH